jgi:hypothetical protein
MKDKKENVKENVKSKAAPAQVSIGVMGKYLLIETQKEDGGNCVVIDRSKMLGLATLQTVSGQYRVDVIFPSGSVPIFHTDNINLIPNNVEQRSKNYQGCVKFIKDFINDYLCDEIKESLSNISYDIKERPCKFYPDNY